MRFRRISWAVVVLAGLAVGCGTTRPITGVEAGRLDKKYTLHSWIEEGELVTLVINTKVTREREGQPFIPIEIAVANTGLRKLTLTRESFTLLDAEGRRYPVGSPKEILEGYDFLNMDAATFELEPIVENAKFAAFRQYPSQFSPSRERFSGVVRNLIALPKFGYIVDVIYFPAPAGGVKDQYFELFLDSPDLEDPVFVKFEVR